MSLDLSYSYVDFQKSNFGKNQYVTVYQRDVNVAEENAFFVFLQKRFHSICQNPFTFMSLSSVFERVLFPDIQIFMFFSNEIQIYFFMSWILCELNRRSKQSKSILKYIVSI